jgi:hypothetical protein
MLVETNVLKSISEHPFFAERAAGWSIPFPFADGSKYACDPNILVGRIAVQ